MLQNNYELKCLGWDQKASLLPTFHVRSTNFWLARASEWLCFEIGQWRLQGHECWDSSTRFQTSSATSCIVLLVELQFLWTGFEAENIGIGWHCQVFFSSVSHVHADAKTFFVKSSPFESIHHMSIFHRKATTPEEQSRLDPPFTFRCSNTQKFTSQLKMQSATQDVGT